MWTEVASADCRVTLLNNINLFWSRRTSVSCSSLFFCSSRVFPRCSESSAQTSECNRSALLTLEQINVCMFRWYLVTLNLLHIWWKGHGDNRSVHPPPLPPVPQILHKRLQWAERRWLTIATVTSPVPQQDKFNQQIPPSQSLSLSKTQPNGYHREHARSQDQFN